MRTPIFSVFRTPFAVRLTVLAVALAGGIPRAAAAQRDPALVARLDSIAGADVAAGRAVGLVVAVVKGKDPLLLKAYGSADVDSRAALTANTVMAIGSVTKQFTAAAVLQLRDAGKLTLDDPLGRWLPELAARAEGVTLRHLLSHTGGIVEFGQIPELRALRLMMNPDVSRDSLYGIVSRQAPQFPPATAQTYSNTGYWLLGRVIEKASGLSYEQYLTTRIFEPLGMKRSAYCTAAREFPDRAAGHGMRNGAARRAPDVVHTATFSAGAICSTAGDLVTWLQALHGGKVVSPRSYAEMIAPYRLTDGVPVRYGIGLTVWNDSRGRARIGHDGGGFGYSSQAWWDPAAELAIVVLTNSEPDNTAAIAEALSAAVLPAGPAPVKFAGDTAPLVGSYGGKRGPREMVVVITATADGLAASVDGGAAMPLVWVEGVTFRGPAAQLTFRGVEGAPAGELRLDTGGDHIILKRR